MRILTAQLMAQRGREDGGEGRVELGVEPILSELRGCRGGEAARGGAVLVRPDGRGHLREGAHRRGGDGEEGLDVEGVGVDLAANEHSARLRLFDGLQAHPRAGVVVVDERLGRAVLSDECVVVVVVRAAARGRTRTGVGPVEVHGVGRLEELPTGGIGRVLVVERGREEGVGRERVVLDGAEELGVAVELARLARFRCRRRRPRHTLPLALHAAALGTRRPPHLGAGRCAENGGTRLVLVGQPTAAVAHVHERRDTVSTGQDGVGGAVVVVGRASSDKRTRSGRAHSRPAGCCCLRIIEFQRFLMSLSVRCGMYISEICEHTTPERVSIAAPPRPPSLLTPHIFMLQGNQRTWAHLVPISWTRSQMSMSS